MFALRSVALAALAVASSWPALWACVVLLGVGVGKMYP